MDTKLLLEINKQLMTAGDLAVKRFYSMREEDRAPNFYEEVKPYADMMRDCLQKWQQLANQYIELNRPKYMHATQIANALDAMEQFFVQSFYKETSKKRFLQSVQSVQYTLVTIERIVKGEG